MTTSNNDGNLSAWGRVCMGGTQVGIQEDGRTYMADRWPLHNIPHRPPLRPISSQTADLLRCSGMLQALRNLEGGTEATIIKSERMKCEARLLIGRRRVEQVNSLKGRSRSQASDMMRVRAVSSGSRDIDYTDKGGTDGGRCCGRRPWTVARGNPSRYTKALRDDAVQHRVRVVDIRLLCG